MGYQKCSKEAQGKAQGNPEDNATKTKDNLMDNSMAHGWCLWEYAS